MRALALASHRPCGHSLLIDPFPPAARFSTFAPEFAQHLYTATGLDRIVADWPSDPLHPKRGSQLPTPKGLLENVRVYKYLPGEFFGPHYDESVPSPVNPSFFSQWTLLIYLNEKGVPVEGGDTIFHLPGRKNEMLAVQPERGAAMLHRHGSSCMRHEGAPVLKGVKWILRSDLLYGS
jgi:alpha-1,3-mannosyltransferase